MSVGISEPGSVQEKARLGLRAIRLKLFPEPHYCLSHRLTDAEAIALALIMAGRPLDARDIEWSSRFERMIDYLGRLSSEAVDEDDEDEWEVSCAIDAEIHRAFQTFLKLPDRRQ